MMEKSFRRYLFMLVVILIGLSALIVTRGQLAFPGQAGPRFSPEIDMKHLDGIIAQRPQIILLGDSMVEENVDTPALSQTLGRPVYTISYPGAASAMWYLSVKNNISVSPHKPKALVILFRDTTLTTPEYRVGGNYNEALDTLAGADEELLIRLAYLNHMNPLEKFARQFFPLYEYGFHARDKVESVIRYLPSRLLLGCGNRCVGNALLNVFNFRTTAAPTANDPVAQSENVLYTDRALDFYRQVNDSFLPEIIRLCRENGIQLILVRGKTISFANIPEPAGLRDYILDLEEYLTKNGVRFADLEADSRLDAGDFIDRYHILPEARGAYTQMLAEALTPLLP
jgi:hypothetical protein